MAPTPAGTIMLSIQIKVTPIVNPKTFSVKGANTKMEICHLSPSSTSEMVGTIDSINNMILMAMQVWNRSTSTPITSNINQY